MKCTPKNARFPTILLFPIAVEGFATFKMVSAMGARWWLVASYLMMLLLMTSYLVVVFMVVMEATPKHDRQAAA